MYKRLFSLIVLLSPCFCSTPRCAAGSSPIVISKSSSDCGPRCVEYICNYMGMEISLEEAYELCGFQNGDTSVSLLVLKKAFESKGLYCLGFASPLSYLEKPPYSNCCFVVWTPAREPGHFTVLVKSKKTGLWLNVDPVGRSVFPVENVSKRDGHFALLAVSKNAIRVGARSAGLERATRSILVAVVSMMALAIGLYLRRKYKRRLASQDKL